MTGVEILKEQNDIQTRMACEEWLKYIKQQYDEYIQSKEMENDDIEC
jgi:hypothetical protein